MATIVFFPEGAYGPTNNCVGIGHALRQRGHRVVFVIEESFAGTLEERGFEERLMRLTPPAETEEEPGQFWKDFIRDTGPVFRRPTIEQLDGFIKPTWQALVDGSKYVDGRLREIFDEVAPDVIVEDNVVSFPAVVTADAPWIRIASCNPLEVPDPELPPVFSGYPTGDRSGWEEFRAEYRRVHADMHADFDAFCRERGCPPLPDMEFIHRSAYLNLFLYPEEADYERSRPLGPMWERLDSCVRKEGLGEFQVPKGEGRLVYLSLGSLGSADVELMQRLVDLLAEGGYRAIVSKGPQHDQIELRDGQAGAELVPQPALLPLVDAVITHGGNNTVTESLHFGKPMVLLPLFWDQYDNAQRMDELGLGVRLPTFEFEDAQLGEAIERLTGDDAVRGRLKELGRRLQDNPGTERAADCIESVRSAEPRARDRA
jgi:MGT family glycosyltransferase